MQINDQTGVTSLDIKGLCEERAMPSFKTESPLSKVQAPPPFFDLTDSPLRLAARGIPQSPIDLTTAPESPAGTRKQSDDPVMLEFGNSEFPNKRVQVRQSQLETLGKDEWQSDIHLEVYDNYDWYRLSKKEKSKIQYLPVMTSSVLTSCPDNQNQRLVNFQNLIKGKSMKELRGYFKTEILNYTRAKNGHFSYANVTNLESIFFTNCTEQEVK